MTTGSIPTTAPEEASDNASRADAPRADPASTESLLEHAYDGIREFDNPLPRWWVWSFVGSFVFSIGYFFHYHVSHNGTSVHDTYEAEVAEARAVQSKRALGEPVTEESLGNLMSDPAATTEGAVVFQARCTPCHGEHAQGLIGPNLTDNSWLHGKGTLSDIYAVVSEGVSAKGMPAWGKQLAPVDVRKVVAFVGTQRGKNVAGKPAEGDLVP